MAICLIRFARGGLSNQFALCLGLQEKHCSARISNIKEDGMRIKVGLPEEEMFILVPTPSVAADTAEVAESRTLRLRQGMGRMRMVLDFSRSDSIIHPLQCRQGSTGKARVELGAENGLASVTDVRSDCELPKLFGRLGVGPFSGLMAQVWKLEVSMVAGKYRHVRSGNNLSMPETIVRQSMEFESSWAFTARIGREGRKQRKEVTIVFKSDFASDHSLDPRHQYVVEIGGLSWTLWGSLFEYYADDELVVMNPVVLSIDSKTQIVFDSASMIPEIGFRTRKLNK